METKPEQTIPSVTTRKIAEFTLNKALNEKSEKAPQYSESELIYSFFIDNEQGQKLPINIYKLFTYPEGSNFWNKKIEEFYSNLSYQAKQTRFNTSFDSILDLSTAHQRSLFGTDGKTVSLVAIDPVEDKVVGHAQRYIVKKSDNRLQEVAVATISDESFLQKGIAFNLLSSLIYDASKHGVEFLEFYTNSKNTPVNKLNTKLIDAYNLKHLEITDKDNPGWSYLYLYIGNDFSKDKIETKVDLEKLKSTLIGDYLLTNNAKTIRQNSSLSPIAVSNINELVLERAQGVYLLAYFEEVYNAVHPRKSNKKTKKAKKKRSFFNFKKG